MNNYQHRQYGWLMIGIFGGAISVIFSILFSGKAPEASDFLLLMLGLLAIGYLMFYQLTVTVDDKMITISMGIGWIKKRILLEDVSHCEIVKNPWWYGWGIRLTPKGWIYNVSGLKAVQINLNNGRAFRVGTDDANELAAVIEAKTSDLI